MGDKNEEQETIFSGRRNGRVGPLEEWVWLKMGGCLDWQCQLAKEGKTVHSLLSNTPMLPLCWGQSAEMWQRNA